ncbi:MAG: amidohydrolase [Candidatus Aenigmarchaeota archaeon]|nr:amidohydrolase [Candidatus Aenigmarchaeota archaeon]
MLLKNVRFAATPKGILENVNIEIEGPTISKISKTVPVGSKTGNVIDCSRLLAVPSFVNAHTHVPMTFLRGYGEGLTLNEWLTTRVWPAEAKLKPKDVHAFTKMGIIEMIRSGTTAFNDMYFFMDEVARACAESGVRGFLSHGIISLKDKTKDLKETERFIREWKSKNELVTPFVGPHAIYTCDEETLLRSKELAEKYKTKLHIHLSETRKEVYDCWRAHGMRPVEYLDKIGFLGTNVIAAHCGWLTKNEIKILGERRVNVVHCPVSNMKLATGGEMPLPELLATRANVALGTDGASSNNSLSMFGEMKMAALLHKHARWDPTVAGVDEVLKMATMNGAHALGLDAGILEEGKLADITLIDLDSTLVQPVVRDRLLAHLVYAADSSCISTVVCNGKILMQDKIMRVDEENVREAFVKAFAKFS